MWKYDIAGSTWTHLSGSQLTSTPSNYNIPHPGGLQVHSMAIDNTDSYIYVFGGNGLDGGSPGIFS